MSLASKDSTFRQAGIGLHPNRLCMGCNKPRQQTGSTGQGLRWRCVHCSEKRASK